TYVPHFGKVGLVLNAFADENVALSGPLTCVQVGVSVPFGKPSSVAVPVSVPPVVGSVCAGPALATGARLTTVKVTLEEREVPTVCVSCVMSLQSQCGIHSASIHCRAMRLIWLQLELVIGS